MLRPEQAWCEALLPAGSVPVELPQEDCLVVLLRWLQVRDSQSWDECSPPADVLPAYQHELRPRQDEFQDGG